VVVHRASVRRFAVALGTIALFALSCGGSVDADPKAGRLSRSIIAETESGGFFRECVYDASVTLDADGRVIEVTEVGTSAAGRIRAGMLVEGAAAVFPGGVTMPAPVHLDGEDLRGSYAFCVDAEESPPAS